MKSRLTTTYDTIQVNIFHPTLVRFCPKKGPKSIPTILLLVFLLYGISSVYSTFNF